MDRADRIYTGRAAVGIVNIETSESTQASLFEWQSCGAVFEAGVGNSIRQSDQNEPRQVRLQQFSSCKIRALYAARLVKPTEMATELMY